MICPTCCNPMQKTKRHHQYRECGLDNVFLHNCPTFVCEACNLNLPLLPNAEEAAVTITERLLRQPSRLGGAAIRFCRKAAALDGAALADILVVGESVVYRWENDDLQIDGLNDLKLRLEVLERLYRVSDNARLKDEIIFMFRRLYPATASIKEQKIIISSEDLALSSFSFAKPTASAQQPPSLLRKNQTTQ